MTEIILLVTGLLIAWRMLRASKRHDLMKWNDRKDELDDLNQRAWQMGNGRKK